MMENERDRMGGKLGFWSRLGGKYVKVGECAGVKQIRPKVVVSVDERIKKVGEKAIAIAEDDTNYYVVWLDSVVDYPEGYPKGGFK